MDHTGLRTPTDNCLLRQTYYSDPYINCSFDKFGQKQANSRHVNILILKCSQFSFCVHMGIFIFFELK